MYKRILCAVDGSNTSQRAFTAALDLAASVGATLTPFYVVDSAPTYFEAPGYDPSILRGRLVDEGKKLGADFDAAMKSRGVAGQTMVEEAASTEDIAEVVLRAAASFGCDLLVMGTHGRRGVQRLFLGSVAERCLRQANLPVLLIPSAAGQEKSETKTASL